MYCKAWKYTVLSNQAKFEEVYGRNGQWFKFFEPCDDFLGQDLMKGADDETTYMVLDKWMSEEDYEAYIAANQAEYELLESQTRELFEEEISLGSYSIIQ